MFARKQSVLETVIGGDTSITGEIVSQGTVRIDGTVEGSINADWIVIGEPGKVRGEVKCRGIVVGGSIEGTTRVGEVLEIRSRGQVVGDIYTQKLAVSEGGVLEGRCFMKDERPEHQTVLPLISEK